MKIIKLVKKAQKGNEKAFIKLFGAYEGYIYKNAFVYVKNEHDALDIVQEVAYRSFKNLKSLKQPEYFKTWLTRITITCSIDFLKQRKKVISLFSKLEEKSQSELEDVSLNLSLQELINHLDEDEKAIILLKYYDDYTFQDIASILDIPIGTAKSILYRALKKLRKKGKGVMLYE
ncbi:sigma-70 family RNA polymerase sigma factor [Bacillus sp. SCS-153A]|uniref:sigma-70 family RNA polymerase sigma factor n=1 Tax=Rossellomorea sedimentorum TaxID=3115294 RepID=UPI003905826D